ncbi:MAG: CopG family transcriptional regulator [Thermoanaerobaculia bacterium]|nr:CopG family transcriptional regulator [Thermoanaerobaculia bacterium]
MKNVTIVLEEEVARWIRVRAAEEDTSVSRLVGEILREMMTTETRYEASAEDFDSVRPRKLRRSGELIPARDDLYDLDLR